VEELRFTYTTYDLVAAARLHMMRSARGYVLCAYLLLVLVVGAVFSIFGAWDFGLFLVALAVLAFLVVYSIVLPFFARRQARKIPAFRKGVVLRFDENEIHLSSDAGEGSARWFYKTRASDKVLLLYTTHLSYIIVPRRVCEDDAQYERLKRLGEKLAQPKTNEQE
jgi:hypothetical protein